MKYFFFVSLFFLTQVFVSKSHAEFSSQVLIVRHPFTHFIDGQFHKIVDTYNKTAKVKLVTEKFGDYKTSFEQTVSSSDFNNGPDILLGSEFITTAMVRNHPDQYIPIEELFDVSQLQLLPMVQGFYSFNGHLQSLPFACSTAAVFYNEDKIKAAGITHFPKTWEELAEVCRKHNLTFTFGWPMAYVFEHWSVVNGIPFSQPNNGFEMGDVTFEVNRKAFQRRLDFLRDLKKEGILIYSRENNRKEVEGFIKGQYDIVMNGANWEGFIKLKAPALAVGVAPYPYDKCALPKGRPFALNVGGTSLWVMNKPDLNREAVKDFLTYLASPQTQARWHQLTGYVPTTLKAYELSKENGFYVDHPAHRVAVEQVARENVKYYGVRSNNYAEIRDLLHEAIDAVLIEDQEAATVLDHLVEKINHIANS